MDIKVQAKFSSYPADIVTILEKVRALIFSVAKYEGIEYLEETTKWGEPSYIAKTGSTIRFDYKVSQPGQVCIYFNCNTKLIATFKAVYQDTFIFLDNRAIILKTEQTIPTKELSHCLAMALRYKQLKHLPLLGA